MFLLTWSGLIAHCCSDDRYAPGCGQYIVTSLLGDSEILLLSKQLAVIYLVRETFKCLVFWTLWSESMETKLSVFYGTRNERHYWKMDLFNYDYIWFRVQINKDSLESVLVNRGLMWLPVFVVETNVFPPNCLQTFFFSLIMKQTANMEVTN